MSKQYTITLDERGYRSLCEVANEAHSCRVDGTHVDRTVVEGLLTHLLNLCKREPDAVPTLASNVAKLTDLVAKIERKLSRRWPND